MAANTIIFDLGGVIMESSDRNVENFISKEFNLSIGRVKSSLFMAGRSLIEGKKSEAEFWNGYAKEMNRQLPSDWEIKWKKFNEDGLETRNKVLEIASALKAAGTHLSILSNISYFQLRILRPQKRFPLFSPQFFSCELGLSKPDKRIYQVVLQALARTPQECVFIDDEWENVRVASSLGIDSIHFSSALDLSSQLIDRHLL